MAHSFIKLCYNIKPDGEGMQANPNEKANLPNDNKAKEEMEARDATRKRALALKMHNDEVKRQAKREVRRPGMDYSMLFQFLDQLVGNKNIKGEAIRDIVEESLRFKRRRMAQQLVDYMQKMKMNNIPNIDNYCQHCKIMYPRERHSCQCLGRNIG